MINDKFQSPVSPWDLDLDSGLEARLITWSKWSLYSSSCSLEILRYKLLLEWSMCGHFWDQGLLKGISSKGVEGSRYITRTRLFTPPLEKVLSVSGVLSSNWSHFQLCNAFSSMLYIVPVQSLSCVWLSVPPRTAARHSSLCFIITQSLLKLMSTESVMPSNCLILWHLLLLLPSIFPSIRVFSSKLALWVRWPKHWNFSFSPSNEYPRLISFRTDWFYLLAVQGTLKSLLQYHSSKASILRHTAFRMVQLSHPYMTTEKTIALTRQTFYFTFTFSKFFLW